MFKTIQNAWKIPDLRKKDQIATAYSLGLKKIGNETIQPDNEATRGKIAKISHLVEVTEA